jgi:5-formyltetrahydrofolate cyclo-ligase
MADMVAGKAELRIQARHRRDSVGADLREVLAVRLAEAGARIVGEQSPVESPVVSLYSAIGSEPDPAPLAAALHAAAVRLALPVDWSPGTPLVYRQWKPGDRLAPGPLGIREPLPETPEFEPDILFMPLLAFDRRGQRIGYGAGNVDRTLTQLRAHKRVLAIGAAFSIQEIDEVPTEPQDDPLDLIITEHEIIVAGR